MEKVKNTVAAVLIFPVAAFIVSVLAGMLTETDPMFVLAALSLLTGAATVHFLDKIYRAISVEKKKNMDFLLAVIFILLAGPCKDLSFYLLDLLGVFYVLVDEILFMYFYASYVVSGAIFNFMIRI